MNKLQPKQRNPVIYTKLINKKEKIINKIR